MPGGKVTPGGSFGMFGTCTSAANSHLPALIASAAWPAPAKPTARIVRTNTLRRFIVFLSAGRSAALWLSAP
jgi:hypothetical protein